VDERLYIPIDSCPLCGCLESKIIREEQNNFNQDEAMVVYEKEPVFIKLCPNCDFAYVDRLPKDPVFFANLYNKIKYDYEYEFNFYGKKEIYKDIKRQLKKHCATGTLLDIGTWCGTLVKYMDDTYSVVGCEIHKEAAAYGRQVGLDIRTGAFDSVGFDKSSFDVVTIIDVLEHLPNPKQVLEKIFDLLKEGGFLYIKVPNGKAQIKKQDLLKALGLSNKGVGENFIHINHFGHNSLGKVLNGIGFEVVEQGYTKAEIWDLSFPESSITKVKKWSVNAIKSLGTGMVNSISSVSTADLGFNIYVIAKKMKPSTGK